MNNDDYDPDAVALSNLLAAAIGAEGLEGTLESDQEQKDGCGE